MSDNLELWHKVEKTDPKHTKKANVAGNKITCIAPQYQILNATREFGGYGIKWGWKSLDLDYSLLSQDLIILKGVFFYPNGEFPIINSIKLFKDNAKTKIDDDFAKKVETDALTKALSKLGFNADIFMGRYDDVKYLAEVTKEFTPKPPVKKIPILTKEQFEKALKADKKGVEATVKAIQKGSLCATKEQKETLEKTLKLAK